jgi:hypothetical protein
LFAVRQSAPSLAASVAVAASAEWLYACSLRQAAARTALLVPVSPASAPVQCGHTNPIFPPPSVSHGDKNTPSQVKQDAINLCGAECRDTDALRKNMLDRGYDPKLVDDAIRQFKEQNTQTGVTK